MSQSLPSISIAFSQTANTTIQQGQRGIVALIMKDATNNGALTCETVDDIPNNLSAYNQLQIENAFIGGLNPDGSEAPPNKVIAYIEPTTASDYSAGMNYLESVVWNYLAVPGISSGDVATVSAWVIGLRTTKNKIVSAVLPNEAGNQEGIINFCTGNIAVGSNTYSAADYCSRIAGILAGIPLTISSTYQVLGEVSSVPPQTIAQLNAAIAAGELVLFMDGNDVRIALGVTSLTTLTSAKGADFQKIKLVAIMDQIYNDITRTAHSNYIGLYPNDYDHKCLLISAINSYLETMAKASILDKSADNSVGIDIAAQTAWLETQGVDVSKLTSQQIKEYNTGANVFLAGGITPVDAMENIAMNFTLGV